MVAPEEIIERQALQISDLQREILDLKSKEQDSEYRRIVYDLQDELFSMHSKVGELYHANDLLRDENNALKLQNDKLNGENLAIKEQYDTIINSRTWRSTQFLRDILWKLKGGKANVE